MAEIRVNVTASKSQRVNVSSSNIATEISATPDTSQYYSNLAKNWAIAENIVNNEDYSSKHYAKEAQQASALANAYKEATEQAYISFSEQYANAETELTSIKDASLQEINTAVTDGKTEITTAKDLAVDAVNNTKTTILQDIEFVADGEKEEIRDLADDIKENANDIINRVSLSMFDTILKDHILTYEESKGLALQGTWVYKTAIAGERYGYPNFYNKVVEEYNQATTTETVNGVTVKVHSNGHKFYDIANKSAIDSSFNSLGTAWFYGVDITNERVFLPRNNYITSYIANGNKTVSVKGNGKALGLIDGAGHTVGLAINGDATAVNGKTSAYGATLSNTNLGGGYGTMVNSYAAGLTTDSTKSGITGTVNITNTQTGQYLYICVGNTVSDTSWIDVVTQVEGGVKDLEDKTLEGLNRLNTTTNNSIADIHTTAKSYDNLTHRNITNCLLEVPQRIKLELNNGTLTLKAGSVITVPNGFEADGTTPKFDYVTIESDRKLSSPNDTVYMVYNTVTGGFDYMAVTASSNTQITTLGINYNTSTNNIKIYSSNNVVYSNKVSFPFIKVTGNGTAITSINQVFNGVGYIGSTVWVDKGVKVLIPNGRNEDGTLRNIEVVTNNVQTVRCLYTDGLDLGIKSDGKFVANTFNGNQGNYFVDKLAEKPAVSGTYSWCFSNQDNSWYANSGTTTWTKFPIAYIGKVFCDSNLRTTSAQFKQPFRAVDYSDKREISGWGMPSDKYVNLTLGASGTTYTAPANGWFCVCKQAGTAGAAIEMVNLTNMLRISLIAQHASNGLSLYIPVAKGDKCQIGYGSGLTGTTQYFRFIYAEGEQ